MRLFLKYVYLHRKSFTFYFLFSFIFYFIFWLYRLPLYAVHYAFLLCFVIGFIAVVVDYRKFVSHHRRLEDLQKRIMVDVDELGEAETLIDEDYQQLIRILHEDKIALISEKDRMYEEMMEYYTMWAHQIKTPIAAMHLLLSEKNEIECEEELFKIEQYVEMVLTYLKSDFNGNDYRIEMLDLDKCIKQSIRKYAMMFIRKKLTIEYEGCQLHVLSDEKWLCFIIEQILSNAIKYTNQGCVRIFVEDETLVIEDSGIGIQEEDIPRVFDKGFTGYNGRKDKKSTGIGLYLVKRICEKLGHKISIESELGKYTRVKVNLHHYPLEVE